MGNKGLPYVRLQWNYFQDEKIMKAGGRAELLYVRGLAWCAYTLSDGQIKRYELTWVGRGLSQVSARSRQLVVHGLWAPAEDGDGFVIVNWSKHNRSAEEIIAARHQDADRKKATRSGRSPRGVQADKNARPAGLQPPDTDTGPDRTPSGPVRSGPARPTRRDAGGAASVAPDGVGVGSDPDDPPIDGDPKEYARRAIAEGQRKNRSSTGRNAALRRAEWLPDRSPRPDPFAALNAAIAEMNGTGESE